MTFNPKEARALVERPDLPEAFSEPGCTHVWFGVDDCGKAWWRIDTIMDGAETASHAVLPEAHQAALDEIERLRGFLRKVGRAADSIGNHCVGCGHLCGDPDKDLTLIRKAGGRSCCPEREIEPLSETIFSMIGTDARAALKGGDQ